MQNNFFYENILLIPAVAFVITVFLKGLYIKLTTGKIDLNMSLGTGGMPSVHSSVVVSLATAVALKYGIHHDLFAITVTFTMIIIYDAINIRFEAGQHAKELNKHIGEKRYKESLGHLPSEAFAGSILGILVAYLLQYI
ncbi:divergent PAP2 family protein [Candidatus Gracilibacteria bacterium]|nr:MAG: divergent PAP2 family protein [Candidatus Gracilibacteria bacterium]